MSVAGIAIISDIFMSSIEVRPALWHRRSTAVQCAAVQAHICPHASQRLLVQVITSLEKQVYRKDKEGSQRQMTVLVWNASVANLSLMALGSSAPEIMIAVIEAIVSLGSTPGEIGPSTIVGMPISLLTCEATLSLGHRSIHEPPFFYTLSSMHIICI